MNEQQQFFDPRAIPGTPGYIPPPPGYQYPSDTYLYGAAPYPNQQMLNQYPNSYQQKPIPFSPDDPTIQFSSPQQQQIPYHFMRRINQMNWEMVGNIDVPTIAKTNDTASIEFLMRPIAFANITAADAEQFGTRASLHAFLILQLAVEYLLNKLNNIPVQPQYIPVPSKNEPSQLISNYEARIDILNKDIHSRDMIIEAHVAKMKKLEQQRDELIAKLQSKPVTQSIPEIGDAPSFVSDSSILSETGKVNGNTLKKFKKENIRIKRQPSDSDYEYYYSDDDESVVFVPSNKSKSKHSSQKQKEKSKSKSHKHGKKPITSKKSPGFDFEFDSSSWGT